MVNIQIWSEVRDVHLSRMSYGSQMSNVEPDATVNLEMFSNILLKKVSPLFLPLANYFIIKSLTNFNSTVCTVINNFQKAFKNNCELQYIDAQCSATHGYSQTDWIFLFNKKGWKVVKHVRHQPLDSNKRLLIRDYLVACYRISVSAGNTVKWKSKVSQRWEFVNKLAMPSINTSNFFLLITVNPTESSSSWSKAICFLAYWLKYTIFSNTINFTVDYFTISQ